jgi:predicted membrane protein
MENKNHLKTLCILLAISNLFFMIKDFYHYKNNESRQKEILEQVISNSVNQVVQHLKQKSGLENQVGCPSK